MRRLVSLAVLLGCSGDPGDAAHLPGEACPEGMRHLPELSACIDPYEAALEGEGDRVRAVSAEGRLPADGVSWHDADAACRNAGRRLCTAREWHRACTGVVPSGDEGEPTGRAFPYGDEFEADRCNSLEDGVPTAPPRLAVAGAHPRCVTPEGVFDLSGNVFEWLSDAHPAGGLRELRGGSYGTFERYAHCVTDPRQFQPPDSVASGRGFRCCADAGW